MTKLAVTIRYFKCINPRLVLLLIKEIHSTELEILCYSHTVGFAERQGRSLFQIKRVLYPSNYLNFLKVLNFKQTCDFSKDRLTDMWQLV